MIAALLRKDLRINLVPIVGNLTLVSAAYAMALIVALSESWGFGRSQWPALAASASAGAAQLTLLLTAVYAGTAFAQERRDRSADFLAMLPASRRNILISKFIVACSIPLIFMALNALVNILSHKGLESHALNSLSNDNLLVRHIAFSFFMPWNDPWFLAMNFSLGVMLFGIGWRCSVSMRSPALAASIAIFATVFVNLLVILVNDRIVQAFSAYLAPAHLGFISDSVPIRSGISFIIGVECFVVGSLNFLRRVEP